MKLTKQQRQQLHAKYNGKCAYCGDPLPDRWAADHIEPIQRNYYYCKERKRHVQDGTCINPDLDTFDNLAPSCPSCNTIKGSSTLEGFRRTIRGFTKSLNRDSTQYKFAKRYGLVQEVEKDVVFYFEK